MNEEDLEFIAWLAEHVVGGDPVLKTDGKLFKIEPTCECPTCKGFTDNYPDIQETPLDALKYYISGKMVIGKAIFELNQKKGGLVS